MTTDPLSDLRSMIEMMKAATYERPDMSAAEMITLFEGAAAQMDAIRTGNTRPCLSCGHDVSPTGSGDMVHITPSGQLSSRGCRAASFDRRQEAGLDGWDESIRKHITAR